MRELEEQKRITEINEICYENRASSTRAPSAKTGVSHVTCYRIITQILKRRNWIRMGRSWVDFRPAEIARDVFHMNFLWEF